MNNTSKLVFANLKAYKSFFQTKTYLESLADSLANLKKAELLNVGIAVSPISLSLTKNFLRAKFQIVAQDLLEKDPGAFTGSTTADQLKEFNIKYVLVGHSERRMFDLESEERVLAKVKYALLQNLIPIFCFGESLEDRKNEVYQKVLKKQLQLLKNNLDKEDISKLIFAYEPVWAIGTGLTASISDIVEISLLTRAVFQENQITFIYGGSVNAKNVQDILKNQLIDGVLVGSASLEVETFLPIIEASFRN